MYIRKTVDVYALMGNYGYGWDYILYEETFGEAKRVKREYVENEKNAFFKIVNKRVSKEIYDDNQEFNNWLHSL